MPALESPAHSLSPRGLAIAGWIAFLLALGAFIALAWGVEFRAPLLELDTAVSQWFGTRRTARMTQVMFAATYVHSIAGTIVLSVVFAAVLAKMREWYWMLTLTLATIGGMLLNVGLKFAYERARPHFDDPLLVLTTPSFPSGHTAGATIFYGVLAAFLVTRVRDPRGRVAIVLGAVTAVFLVALSRVYLGAHYPSDVAAAACSSLALLVVVLNFVHGLVKGRRRERATR